MRNKTRVGLRSLWAAAAIIAGVSCSSGQGVSDAGSSSAAYSACLSAGGCDRLFILKVDADRVTCTRLILISLCDSSPIALTVPPGWGIQEAAIFHQQSDCTRTEGPGAAVSASGGTGTIAWTPADAFPSQVAAHATLTFPQSAGSWVPATDRLDADAIAVSGCP